MILYSGRSLLDPSRQIVMIATGYGKRPSTNVKTGPMIQTWIIDPDINPTEAAKRGHDTAACGACELRPVLGGAKVSLARAELARRLGWRIFWRTDASGAPAIGKRGLIACPASDAGGNRRQCETCLACDGGREAKASVWIPDHGNYKCYVRTAEAPLAVWRTYRAGKYPSLTGEGIRKLIECGRPIRFGSHGDPCAVPVETIETLARVCGRWTGYTHQWTRPHAQAYRQFLMASV